MFVTVMMTALIVTPGRAQVGLAAPGVEAGTLETLFFCRDSTNGLKDAIDKWRISPLNRYKRVTALDYEIASGRYEVIGSSGYVFTHCVLVTYVSPR